MLVTPAELAAWLDRYHGGNRICAVTMLTPLKMNQKSRLTGQPNPYLLDGESTIDHLQERVVMCGTNWEAAINRAWQAHLTPDERGNIPYFEAAALWAGKGTHLNPYIVEHTEKHTLYLYCVYASLRGEDRWVEHSLRQEAWLDRLTGLQLSPDWNDLAQYLPPAPKASVKQGCRDGVDVELTIEGGTFTIHGGENKRQLHCKVPHLENVLSLRSFDLQKRGQFEVVQLKRTAHQISV